MPLILCSDCNKEISDRAPNCPHCGAPNATIKAAPPPSMFAAPPPNHPDVPIAGTAQCPFCKLPIPEGATVCHCGAYLDKAISTPRQLLIIGAGLGMSIISMLLGIIAGSFVVGVVAFVVCIVLIKVLMKVLSVPAWHIRRRVR